MRKIFSIAAAAVLAICAIQVLYLAFGRDDTSSDVKPSSRANAIEPLRVEPASQTAGRNLELPRNVKQAVDFAVDEGSFADFTARERRDQYLDWLLFTTVAALQPSAEEYNKILFDLPTSRQGYMRPVGNFEFGETRSRFIGNDQALALIPAKATAAQRKDFLASIADEQRKNLGGRFQSLVVVEYELDAEHARGALTRRDDIGYAALFSAEYGYHEALVTNAVELGQFMKVVPDLTAIELAPTGLKLGGRQLLARKYRSIDIEQVATVWQSEQKLHKALDDWMARRKQAFDELDSRWAGRLVSRSEKEQIEKQLEREAEEVNERFAKEYRTLKLVGGSGFSLDPAVDFEGLKKDFASAAPSISSTEPSMAPLVSAASEGLANNDIVPFLKLVAALSRRNLPMGLSFEELKRKDSYQAARYDGELQGTEVGMVLFYTDLLAKLWAIDYERSSPRHRDIRDFVDHPSIEQSQIYWAESEKYNQARLWFGYTDLGFQLVGNKDGVLFARNVTRIYSAGSNPLKPGVETAASVFLAGPITWWNDHYEEVAQFEPEYERLNQIMKWSVAIGWLNEIQKGDRLGYLAGIPVDRSKVFPTWAANHANLRFGRWHDVGFHPAGYKGAQTEALPLLSGPVTEGGVSLASKDVAKRAPLAEDLERVASRSTIDYAASTKDTLKGLDGTIFKFGRGDARLASTIAKAKPEAKFRGPATQLAHSDVQRTIAVRADFVGVETKVADVPLGEFDVGRVPNGFRVGWRAREVDRALSIARTLSSSPLPDVAILGDPTVEAAIKLPGEAAYVVKLQGSPRWVRLAPEERPSVDIAPDWQIRTAEPGAGAVRRMQASVVDEAQVRGIVATQTHVVLEGGADGRPLLRLASEDVPADLRVVDVEIGTERLSAWLQPPADSLAIKAKGGSEFDTIGLARRLGREEIDAIRKTAANSNVPPIVRVAGASRARADLPSALENRDFRTAASAIADDPEGAYQVLNARLTSDLQANSALLQSRGPNAALHDLDRLIAVYGEQPDLMLQRGLIQIERGSPQLARESAMAKVPGPLRNRQVFFDEVNARLRSAPDHARADILRFAEYVDWQDIAIRPGRVASEGISVRPAVVADRFDFEIQLAAMPRGKPLSLADFDNLPRGKGLVYRQESAGLNAVDWTASTDQSLRQVIAGDLGKVIRLPQQDIAHFRPVQIWAPEHALPFKGLESSIHHLPAGAGNGGYQACNLLTDACSKSDQDQGRQEVYLVVAK
jgi:hypothetical protein